MKHWNNWIFLVVSCMVFKTRGEVFSAVSGMECLLRTQENVIHTLEHLVSRKNCKIKIVKKYLDLCKQEYDIAAKDYKQYLGNPINSFKLMKRLSVDLDYIENVINKRTDFVKNTSLMYPTQVDLEGAAEAILRLETVYQLNTTQLADGVLNNAYGSPMTTSDCLELGKALFKLKYYKHGINWLNEALRKHDDGLYDDGRYSIDDILKELSYGYDALDDFVKNFVTWMTSLEALSPKANEINVDHLIGAYRTGVTPEEMKIDIATQDPKQQESIEKPKGLESLDNIQVYHALCGGKYKLPIQISKSLQCYYAVGPHPFLTIAPIKAELLHRAPDIVLFHDVINDKEMQTIVDTAKPKLERGQVTNGQSNRSVADRICKVTFLNDSDVVRRVRRRVSHFSGLDLTETGKLQVANYGMGGHYGPHYDFWKNESYVEINGNRIATTLFYLSDVGQSGATVFTKLGITVFPVKGAALFWTNLLSSGEGDYRTLHAACPVLMGSKWIMNLWINLRGQELKQKHILNLPRYV